MFKKFVQTYLKVCGTNTIRVKTCDCFSEALMMIRLYDEWSRVVAKHRLINFSANGVATIPPPLARFFHLVRNQDLRGFVILDEVYEGLSSLGGSHKFSS